MLTQKLLLVFLVFIIFSCAEPNSPFHVGNDIFRLKSFVNTPGLALDVEVYQNKAYVATSEAGISVVEFTSDTAFVTQTFKKGISKHLKLKILESDSLLFVLPELARLYAFKIPANLDYDELSSTNSKIPQGLAIIKKNNEFRTYYTAKPKEESPFSLYFSVSKNERFPLSFWENQGFSLTRGEPKGIFADTNFVYVADGELGLTVTNLQGEIQKTYDLQGEAQDVFLKDDFAFVTCGTSGVFWIDLRVFIQNGSESGSFDTEGFASECFFDGKYLFVADGNNGLVVLDLSDKKNPKLSQTYKTKDANALTCKDGLIFVADDDGLYIFGE
ncbi:hypothetical protein IT568_12990 [bacterium]|nr:hypothetical protein [bacterium]